MRTVILLVGPRAAGKSTFCEKALTLDPSLVLVSRDKMLIELFGQTLLCPYSGDHHYGEEKAWEAVADHLRESPERDLLFDMWNDTGHERQLILKELRKLGAERVVAWFFVTPVEYVEAWFWQKPDIAKISEMSAREGEDLAFYPDDAPKRDHKLFHEYAATIETDGFDEIVRIDPVTTGPEHVLKLQAGLGF